MIPDPDASIYDGAVVVKLDDTSVTEITVGSERGPRDPTCITVARLVYMTILEVGLR